MVNTEFRCAASGWTHHFKSKLKNTLRVHWLGSARLGLARFASCSHSLFVSSARFGSQTLQKLHQFGVLFVCLFASLPPLSPPPLLPVPLDPHNPVQLGVTRYSTGRAAAISVPLRAAPAPQRCVRPAAGGRTGRSEAERSRCTSRRRCC